jgi:hypothetical protein
MHRRISTILRRLRQDLAEPLATDFLLAACRAAGHTWSDSALLTPAAIIHWFLVQVLHGNTALTHVALLAGHAFTASAFCQARARLPLGVFQAVLRHQVHALIPVTQAHALWRGLRAFLVDGSSFSMPDTPALQAHFGQPGNQAKGCGFPVAHLLAMFHAGTGLLLEVAAAPLRTHDLAGFAGVLGLLGPGDLLVADRGFCSFAHLALLVARGVYGVFRVHQRQIVDFTPHRPQAGASHKGGGKGLPHSRWVRGLGLTDQVVAWLKPERRPEWMTAEQYAALPAELLVRELRYRTGRAGFRVREVTLVTTLLDGEFYPLVDLAELYCRRWEVEGHLWH